MLTNIKFKQLVVKQKDSLDHLWKYSHRRKARFYKAGPVHRHIEDCMTISG